MRLIFWTRLDGFGRTRITITTILLILLTAPAFYQAYVDYNSRMNYKDEQSYVADCLELYALQDKRSRLDDERAQSLRELLELRNRRKTQLGMNDREYCAHAYQDRIITAKESRNLGYQRAALGAMPAIAFWFAMGLLGWIYRGFAEKGESE